MDSKKRCWATGKVIYTQPEAAQRAIERINSNPPDGQRKMRAYYECEHCGRLHLTTMPQKKHHIMVDIKQKKKSFMQERLDDLVEKRLEYLDKKVKTKWNTGR